MNAPDQPGDRDQRQAAEELGAFVNPNTPEMVTRVAAALAAVRADEAARRDKLVADLQRLATAFEEEGIDPALPARLRAVLDADRD